MRIQKMKNAGVYIHIPFCRSHCSYCDFATGMYNEATAERYVLSLVNEIESWREVEPPQTVDTIYFGGGTPSLLSPAQLEMLLQAVHAQFKVSPSSEVTIEINPGSATSEVLAAFRALGINRASFGAQTFDDHELARLGRSHTADDTRRTFRYLRDAGFDNISFDLIAGLPGQTMAGWRRNLDEAFSLRPEHLSFYLLEVHQGTPLANHIKSGLQPQPDDDLAAAMYEVMLDRAVEAGYEHYEISNLCLPGYESKHNTKYWTSEPYYGFGCSAHSYDGQSRRWANERNIDQYVNLIESERSPRVEDRQLNAAELRAEAAFLGLRMMRGLNAGRYKERFGIDIYQKHAADLVRLVEAGLIELNGELIKLTKTGALLSNEVFVAFM
jgi:oxygen-independent coproporphyrinogen-3 oxidase